MQPHVDVVCLVALVVVVGGDELVLAREAVHDEVVAGAVETAVDGGRDDQKEPENEGSARAHRTIVVEGLHDCHRRAEDDAGPDVVRPGPRSGCGGWI